MSGLGGGGGFGRGAEGPAGSFGGGARPTAGLGFFDAGGRGRSGPAPGGPGYQPSDNPWAGGGRRVPDLWTGNAAPSYAGAPGQGSGGSSSDDLLMCLVVVLEGRSGGHRGSRGASMEELFGLRAGAVGNTGEYGSGSAFPGDSRASGVGGLVGLDRLLETRRRNPDVMIQASEQ